METLHDIEKKSKKKSKQGYEGYQDMLKDYEKLEVEQIEYLENELEAKKQIYSLVFGVKDVLLLAVAFVALCEPISDKVQDGMVMRIALLYGAVYIGCHLYIGWENYHCNVLLGILRKIKEKKDR